MSMEFTEFINQKLEKLQSLEREKTMLLSGLNDYFKEMTRGNVDIGQTVAFRGVQYEVIDFRPPKIWSYKNLNECKYETLCLPLINGEKDQSVFAKKIRKQKKWYAHDYSRKGQEKLKLFYMKNVINLSQSINLKLK